MAFSDMLTENDERLIAEEIAKLLSQKGVSCHQALRILKMTKKEIKRIPLVELKD